MLQVLMIISPLFLIILLGVILRVAKIADDHWTRVFNQFALKIGFPALIFSSLLKAEFRFSEQGGLMLANSLFLVGSFILAYVIARLFRLKADERRSLFICFGFGNVAYLGIPMLGTIYGDSALPTASLIVAVYLFWMFTLGIGHLDYSRQKDKKSAFKKVLSHLYRNPLLISVTLGLIWAGLRLPIPSVLLLSIQMVSASATPVVLLIIGFFIGKSDWGNGREWFLAFLFSLGTLMLLPGIFYLILLLVKIPPQHFDLSIIQAAMPLAITPFALADDYHLNKTFIARSIVLSTILSVITLPFWISIF